MRCNANIQIFQYYRWMERYSESAAWQDILIHGRVSPFSIYFRSPYIQCKYCVRNTNAWCVCSRFRRWKICLCIRGIGTYPIVYWNVYSVTWNLTYTNDFMSIFLHFAVKLKPTVWTNFETCILARFAVMSFQISIPRVTLSTTTPKPGLYRIQLFH